MSPTNVTVHYPREEQFRTKLNKVCQAQKPKLKAHYDISSRKVDGRDKWTAILNVEDGREWLGESSSIKGSCEAAAKLAFLAFESEVVEVAVGAIDDLGEEIRRQEEKAKRRKRDRESRDVQCNNKRLKSIVVEPLRKPACYWATRDGDGKRGDRRRSDWEGEGRKYPKRSSGKGTRNR